jgi:hypothetical protein
MALGPHPSVSQVWQAMCADYANMFGTNPLTISAERLAASYYGWSFSGSGPASDFEKKGCPAH